jgi:hypothetical protein
MMARKVNVTYKQLIAICTMIQYLVDAEEEECYDDCDEDEKAKHIWNSVVIASDWYNKLFKKIEREK